MDIQQNAHIVKLIYLHVNFVIAIRQKSIVLLTEQAIVEEFADSKCLQSANIIAMREIISVPLKAIIVCMTIQEHHQHLVQNGSRTVVYINQLNQNQMKKINVLMVKNLKHIQMMMTKALLLVLPELG